MQTVPFLRALQGIANSSGTVTLQDGPAVANEQWHLTHVELNNPGPRVPTVNVYHNVIAPSGYIDGTFGGLFNATDTPIDLQASEFLYFVWSLCTPGTTCNVTLRGMRSYAVH